MARVRPLSAGGHVRASRPRSADIGGSRGASHLRHLLRPRYQSATAIPAFKAEPPAIPKPVCTRPVSSSRPRSAGAVQQQVRTNYATFPSAIDRSAPDQRVRPRSAGAAYQCVRQNRATILPFTENGPNPQARLRPRSASRIVTREAPVESIPWGYTPFSFPSALPEELLARSCQASTASDIVLLTQCCRSLNGIMKRIVTDLLRDVHALECRRSSLRMSKLRQLSILQEMQRLSAPAMCLYRKPVVLLAGHHFIKVDDIAPVCHGGSKVEEQACVTGTVAVCQGILPELRLIMLKSVSCGQNHMMLLDYHGHVWAFGDGRAGGITLDADADITRPTLVSALSEVRFAKVVCGNGHTAAMAANGDIFTWGRSLGDDTATEQGLEWQLPDARKGLSGEAVDIAAGETHVGVVSLTGDTYTWGSNHHGQCAKNPDLWGNMHHSLRVPARAGGALANVVARRIACGKYHTVVLSTEGVVYSFGAAMSGQLGRNSSWETSPPWLPDKIIFTADDKENDIHIVQIVCGDEHTLCLTDLGRAFAFGSGCYGQLGLGGVRSYRMPVALRMHRRLSEIAAGANWSLLRERSGKVLQAGRDEDDVDDCRLLRHVL